MPTERPEIVLRDVEEEFIQQTCWGPKRSKRTVTKEFTTNVAAMVRVDENIVSYDLREHLDLWKKDVTDQCIQLTKTAEAITNQELENICHRATEGLTAYKSGYMKILRGSRTNVQKIQSDKAAVERYTIMLDRFLKAADRPRAVATNMNTNVNTTTATINMADVRSGSAHTAVTPATSSAVTIQEALPTSSVDSRASSLAAAPAAPVASPEIKIAHEVVACPPPAPPLPPHARLIKDAASSPLRAEVDVPNVSNISTGLTMDVSAPTPNTDVPTSEQALHPSAAAGVASSILAADLSDMRLILKRTPHTERPKPTANSILLDALDKKFKSVATEAESDNEEDYVWED